MSRIFDARKITGRERKTLEDVVTALQALLPPSSEIICGSKTVADIGTPETLVPAATSCKGVMIMAPCSALGVPANLMSAFVGDNTVQNIPIMSSNIEGVMIQIDDAHKLYVKVGVNGESVNYVIFK